METEETSAVSASTGEGEAAASERGMSESELLTLVAAEINSAMGSWQTELSERRRAAMERYMGELYGDEIEGYSAVVSRDIFEAVEDVLPDLCETFVGGDEVARCLPYGEEDEQNAKLRTKRLNHVFLCENQGFLIAYDWMKDSLIQGNAVVKYWVAETAPAEVKRFSGLPSMGVGVLLDAGAKIVEFGDNGDGSFDVVVEVGKAKQKIEIQNLPNEEFGIDRRASSIETARFVCHVTTTTVGALRDLGYDEEKIQACPGPNRFEHALEREAREALEDGQNSVSDLTDVGRSGADAEREIGECYIWCDFDGSGMSALRRVIVGGRQASVLFSNDRVSFVPMANLSPIKIPHRFVGMGVADAMADLARINTVLKRGYLDSLYNTVRQRFAVLSNPRSGPMADMDQLDALRPGGHVEEYTAGAIRALEYTDITQPALAGLEFLRSLKEERLGRSRMTTGSSMAGTDAETKLHGTAKGLLALMSQSNKRLGLVARLFAETGFKKMFGDIYKLLQEVEDTEFGYRGEKMQAGPDLFSEEREVKLSVGLGYGDKMERLEGLNMIAGLQERIHAATPGLIVRPEHAYNLADEMCELLGYQNQERFFGDPQKAEPQPPPPESWAVEIASKERMHAEDLRMQELELRLKYDLEQSKLQIEAAKVGATINRELAEAEANETDLLLTGGLEPAAQSQRAAEPGGAQTMEQPPPQALL